MNCWRFILRHRAERNLSFPQARDLHAAAARGDVRGVENNIGFADAYFSVNADGQNALAVATQFGHAGVLQTLLLAGMDANAVDRFGDFPLLVAVRNHRVDLVRLLLPATVMRNMNRRTRETPLMAAAAFRADNADEIVVLLLEAGVAVHLLDNQGRSAADLALSHGFPDRARIIKSHGNSHYTTADLEHYMHLISLRLGLRQPAASARLNEAAKTAQRAVRSFLAGRQLRTLRRLAVLRRPASRVQAMWRGILVRRAFRPILTVARGLAQALDTFDAALSLKTEATPNHLVQAAQSLLAVRSDVAMLLSTSSKLARFPFLWALALRLGTPRLPQLLRLAYFQLPRPVFQQFLSKVPLCVLDGPDDEGDFLLHLATRQNDVSMLEDLVPVFSAAFASRNTCTELKDDSIQQISPIPPPPPPPPPPMNGPTSARLVVKPTASAAAATLSSGVFNAAGDTPLTLAVRLGHLDALVLLANHPALPIKFWLPTRLSRQSALLLAASLGNVAAVTVLLAAQSLPATNVNLADDAGLTPLHGAITAGHVDIVRQLLARGAVTAESAASSKVEPPLIHLLLAHDPANCPEKNAAHQAMLDAMLSSKADLEVRSRNGLTAVLLAAFVGNVQALTALVAAGACTTAKVLANNRDAIACAAAGGHLPVIQYLTARRVTALRDAIESGHYRAAQDLAANVLGLKGAPGAPCASQPLELALAALHGDIVTYLLDHDIEPTLAQRCSLLSILVTDAWRAKNSDECTRHLQMRVLQSLFDEPLNALNHPTKYLPVDSEIAPAITAIVSHWDFLTVTGPWAAATGPLVVDFVLHARLLSFVGDGILGKRVPALHLASLFPWSSDQAAVRAALGPILEGLFSQQEFDQCRTVLQSIIKKVSTTLLDECTPALIRSSVVLALTPGKIGLHTVDLFSEVLPRLPSQASVTSACLAETQLMTELAKLQRTAGSNKTRVVSFFAAYFPDYVERCGICNEMMTDPVPVALQTNVEQWRKVVCGHEYCRACMSAWVQTRVSNDHSTHVRCPSQDCKFVLFRDDIVRCAEPASTVVKDFDELQKSDYAGRLADAKKDKKLMEWLASNARACPGCSVIMFKDQGCDSMNCARCGSVFSWSSAHL